MCLREAGSCGGGGEGRGEGGTAGGRGLGVVLLALAVWWVWGFGDGEGRRKGRGWGGAGWLWLRVRLEVAVLCKGRKEGLVCSMCVSFSGLLLQMVDGGDIGETAAADVHDVFAGSWFISKLMAVLPVVYVFMVVAF